MDRCRSCSQRDGTSAIGSLIKACNCDRNGTSESYWWTKSGHRSIACGKISERVTSVGGVVDTMNVVVRVRRVLGHGVGFANVAQAMVAGCSASARPSSHIFSFLDHLQTSQKNEFHQPKLRSLYRSSQAQTSGASKCGINDRENNHDAILTWTWHVRASRLYRSTRSSCRA